MSKLMKEMPIIISQSLRWLIQITCFVQHLFNHCFLKMSDQKSNFFCCCCCCFCSRKDEVEKLGHCSVGLISHLPSQGSPGSCGAFPQSGSACYRGSAAWIPVCYSCAPVCSSGQCSTVRSGPGTAETPTYCGLISHRGKIQDSTNLNHKF